MGGLGDLAAAGRPGARRQLGDVDADGDLDAVVATLDDDVVLEVLADARDNAAYGEPDEFVALTPPDGVAPVVANVTSSAADGVA